MVVVKSETYILPQTEEGRYMAKVYADSMKLRGLEIVETNTTYSIKLEGNIVTKFDENYIHRMMEGNNESTT